MSDRESYATLISQFVRTLRKQRQMRGWIESSRYLQSLTKLVVRLGDVRVLESLLKEKMIDVHQALVSASRINNLRFVAYILGSPDTRRSVTESVIYESVRTASRMGNVHVINVLFDHARINYPPDTILDFANAVLIEAIETDRVKLVAWSLRNGATDYERATIESAERGNERIVSMVLHASGNQFMDVLLMGAARSGMLKYVKMALRRGVTQESLDFALLAAVEMGHRRIADILVDAGASDFDRAVGVAMHEQRFSIAAWLVLLGGQVQSEDLDIVEKIRGG